MRQLTLNASTAGQRFTSWRQRRNVPQRRSRRLGGLESLERRDLLHGNVLDSVVASIDTATSIRTVQMVVATPNAAVGTNVTLIFDAQPFGGSSVDLAPVVVKNSAGQALPVMSSHNGATSHGSVTTVSMPAGQYSVEIRSDDGSTGAFQMDVSLAGDIFPAAGVVDQFELVYATAAMTQSMGTANFVTNTYFQSQGINMSTNLYNAGLDIDGDGKIGVHEVQIVRQNVGTGTVTIDLQSDVSPPVVTPALTEDTGVSNTDRITTNPEVRGTITDESPITSFQVRLDNGAFTNILDRVTDTNFVLNRAFLNQLAGGNLAAGPHTVSFVATDDVGNTVNPAVTFSFVFIDGNQPPSAVTIPTQNATQDLAFSLNVSTSFTDPNPGDVITYSGVNLPGWLTINSTTGVLSGTPRNADVGTVSVTVRGTDSQGATGNATFNIIVANVNDPPVIANIPNQTAAVGSLFTLNLQNFISDPDTDDPFNSLTVSVQRVDGFDASGNPINANPLPAWLTYNATTGVLSGTPATGDIASFTIGLIVTDSSDGIARATFGMQVTGNRPPVLNNPVPDQSATVGSNFSANLAGFFSDPDGDTLTFSLTATTGTVPAWLNFNTTTGVLSGTPGAGDVGTSNLRVTATDTGGLSIFDDFTLTVNEVSNQSVRFALRTLDTSGNEISSIAQGSQFDLVVTVQDIRPPSTTEDRGVFSAFVDVSYNGTLATPTGQFDFNFNGQGRYNAGTSGATVNNGTITAELDEVGGVDGVSPLGTAVFELFRIRFTAGNTPGTITFASNPADQTLQHPVLLFGASSNLDNALIDFGTTAITVTGSAAPMSSSFVGVFTNSFNAYDVNGDGVVTPLDALLVINQMNGTSSSSSNLFLDVNGDGAASPIDALMVINHITAANRTPTAAMSASAVADNDDAQAHVYDLVYAGEGLL